MAMYITTVMDCGGWSVYLNRGYEVIEKCRFLTADGANRFKHKLKNRYGEISERVVNALPMKKSS